MTFRRVPCPPSPSYCRICHRYHDPTPPPESLRSPFEALRAPEPESDPTDLSGVMQAVGVAVPAVTGLLQGIAESRERRIQDRVAAEALCARVEACTLMVTHLGKAGASATAISEAVTEALSTACETFRAVREEAEEDDDDVQAASPASDLEDLLGQPRRLGALGRTGRRDPDGQAQDDVDRKRAELIEEIERQLQTKTSIEPVFTLRWTLGDGAGTTA